jgi:hypothetical protein
VASVQPFGRSRGYVYASAPRPPEDDWIAVVAESFVVLIESGHGDRGVEALTRLAQNGDVSIEDIVSAIPVGADGVDAFAVARCDGDTDGSWQLTIVVRGRAVVDVYSVGGARRFTSSGVQPWLIATFRDVVAAELGGPARRFGAVSHRAPSALAIGYGSAHAGSVLWSAAEAERTDLDAADGDAGYVRPAASFDDDTVRRVPSMPPARRAQEQPATDDRLEPRESSSGGPDEVTVERRTVMVPAGDREQADDAHEVAGADESTGADETAVERASVDAQGSDEGGGATITVTGHESMPLQAPIVIGRKPANTRRSGVAPVLVTVPSPDQVISASHVRIERSGRVVVVTDLRSRNGTTVVVAEGKPRRLRPGESFAVPGAATVEIGDGTSIDITPVTS